MDHYKIKDVEDWTVGREDATRLSVSTKNGGLRLIGTDGDEIRVYAEKHVGATSEQAARDFLAQMTVERTLQDGIWRIETRWPEPRPAEVKGAGIGMEVYAPRDMIFEAKSSNGQVEASGGAEVRLRTSNGLIQVEQCAGPVDVGSSNGRIEIRQARGQVQASTSNGAISVEVEQSAAPVQIELSTSNGKIDLLVPENISAQVEAGTSNGAIKIESERGITAAGRAHIKQTLGNGDGTIRLRTSNGAIRIRTGAPTDSREAVI